LNKFFSQLARIFLSEVSKHRLERTITLIAIGGFLVHLLLILLVGWGWIDLGETNKLLKNPISAIYTPFSFILIYEVYLLVYYLPHSITTYIGKQYQIITLILIRRLFKDLGNIELAAADWFSFKYDRQLIYDIVATLVLFMLIYLYNRMNRRREKKELADQSLAPNVQRFIRIKTRFSCVLVPALFVLAAYSLGDWIYHSFFSLSMIVGNIRDVNQVFFDDFFTLLILTDVLLLLISFIWVQEFRKIIRNSGFVISTILLKLSFSTEGILNPLLIIGAVAFGVGILWIHNLYERLDKLDA